VRDELDILIPADIRFPLERANGVQIVKTAAALARAGARTTLIVRQTDDRPTAEILEGYGVSPDARLQVRRVSVLHRRGSFALPRASFLLRAWVSLLRRPPGSVVFTRDLQLADLLLRLPPPARPQLVYEAHAVESLMYAERGAIYGTAERPRPRKAARIATRERRVWRRADSIVTTTAGIRDSLADLHGPRALTRVIPNGCDVPSDRRFPGLAPADGRRILYAGQLYPWKGVDVLVQALARLPQARLVILGGIEGEPDAARIRALVDALGLGERVEMPGHVGPARVAEELSRASVVAVPFLKTAMTERHTSPLKAFEAMAAGRPLVASDLPSSREFLRDGVNALLVPPGDPAALADAASRLLADRGLAERIARAAWDDSPGYSWDARGEKLLELMSELP
jgi:glycosyltransferase involved in cell wall biosynthesis